VSTYGCALLWLLVIFFSWISAKTSAPCLLIINGILNTILSVLLVTGVTYLWITLRFTPHLFEEWYYPVMVFAIAIIVISQWLNIKYSCVLARDVTRAKNQARDQEGWQELEQVDSSEELPTQPDQFEQPQVPQVPVYYIVQQPQFLYTNSQGYVQPVPMGLNMPQQPTLTQ